MWFWEWLMSIFLFPVKWFWKKYEEFNEERCIWKLILLFAGSLSGMLLIGFVLVWIGYYLIQYHFSLLVVIGIIIWIYIYVKSTLKEKTASNERKIAMSEEMAEKSYPAMRNIMYQTLKSCADAIGGIVPRLLQEIEVLEAHYIINNNICFYQFRLNKADFSMMYTPDDLNEFKRILQVTLSRKFDGGEFSRYKFEDIIDAYGNKYEHVYVDTIEDIDTFFIIQTVFTTMEYADYYRNREVNRQMVSNKPLNVDWKDIS